MENVSASTIYLKANDINKLLDTVYTILFANLCTQILVERTIIQKLIECNVSSAKNYITCCKFHGNDNSDEHYKYNFVGINGKLFLIATGDSLMKVSSFTSSPINYSIYNYNGKFDKTIFIREKIKEA